MKSTLLIYIMSKLNSDKYRYLIISLYIPISILLSYNNHIWKNNKYIYITI